MWMRREDFDKDELEKYVLHPDKSLAADAPKDDLPRPYWIYQVRGAECILYRSQRLTDRAPGFCSTVKI